MKILSLFDGMSVAQQAIYELYKDYEYYASEIDEYAIAVTQSNFPNTIQLGSVTGVDRFSNYNLLEAIKFDGINLLIGGSPCQDLSIAKKDRKGLDGERSGLFFHYVRIRDEVKPKYFILENVASMSKESKDKISEILGVQPVMINASLVSAQNRKRLFWVGKLDEFGNYQQVDIPQPEDKGIMLKDILESGEADRLKSYCIDANYYKGGNLKNYKDKSRRQLVFLGGVSQKDWAGDGKTFSRNWPQGDRVYSPEGKSCTLSAMGGGRGAKTGLYAVGVASRTYPRIKVEGVQRQKQIEYRKDEKANNLTSVQGDSMVATQEVIRKLTPVECLRLQSMPDDYFDLVPYKNKPISNTQRYKMCGNAFNKEVIKHILTQLEI